MKSSLYSGLPETEQATVKLEFNSSPTFREALSKLLERKKEEATVETRSTRAYDSPNWAEKQADFNGYWRALKEIQELL